MHSSGTYCVPPSYKSIEYVRINTCHGGSSHHTYVRMSEEDLGIVEQGDSERPGERLLLIFIL